jgi:hypothetical protein
VNGVCPSERLVTPPMPELKRLIAPSLTPEQVAFARKAFDNAWAEIAERNIGKEAIAIGRTRLATMVLAVMAEGKVEVGEVQRASLALMEKVEACELPYCRFVFSAA